MKYYKQNNYDGDRNYAWQYFTTHAEQRLKTFHFYIIIMTLLIGAMFTLLKLEYTIMLVVMAILMSFFSFVFWKLDERNRELINNAQRTLKMLERGKFVRLFTEEEKQTNTKKERNYKSMFKKHFSYSDCFRWVFKLFGIGGILIALLILLYKLLLVVNKNTITTDSTLKGYIFQEHSLYTNESIYIFIGLFLFFWSVLHYFYSNKVHFKNLLLSSLLSFMLTCGLNVFSFENLLNIEIDKVDLSYKPTNKQDSSHKLTLLHKSILYFDTGEITIQEKLSDNMFFLEHSNNIYNLHSLIHSFRKSDVYYIKIDAFSSLERVVKSNKVTDNYQISIARANSTKEYILNLLISNKFPVNQITFDIFGKSNQNINDEFHSRNRRVEIEIYIIG
jgi:hypothetical protein